MDENKLLKSGKIKKLQGQKETFYRLRLRTYRVIYQKKDDVLIILVLSIKSREEAYKK
jgi:mRNA interferase RelE/StbE